MTRPLIVLTAGGTGGHLFPAEALANALGIAGARVVLVTDKRAHAYAGAFPADEIIAIPSATPSGRSIPQMVKAAFLLGEGTLKAMGVLRRLKPSVVVGFGGYPTVPPVLAAAFLRIPSVIHEANGVMGRANRLLARRAAIIATGFTDVRGIPTGISARLIQTGNPIRPAVLEVASDVYAPPHEGARFNLLVTGGSQGARVMSDIVPSAVALLPPEMRSRLSVVQQARAEDVERVRAEYATCHVAAEIEPFFKDMPRRMAASHLVISRSGASTIAELAVIGRPSILVPLPGAIDQDQAANAKVLGDIGAAIVLPQVEFTPERLAAELRRAFEMPDSLTDAAVAAHRASITDAAERLAQAVLELASTHEQGKIP